MASTIGRLVNIYKGTVLAGTLVATARTKSVSINKELIDFSNDSSDAWRTSAAEAGSRSVDISVEGLVDLAVRTFLTDALAETQDLFTLEYADGSELAGTFNLVSYEESGGHDGEVTYSVSLNSSGAVTFTP